MDDSDSKLIKVYLRAFKFVNSIQFEQVFEWSRNDLPTLVIKKIKLKKTIKNS